MFHGRSILMRSLIPATLSHLDLGQNGMIITEVPGNILNFTGDAGGHDGAGTQKYVEFLFGKECGNYTSADNTTGTKYYPEIEYAISFRSQSKQSTSFITAGVQCKSWHIDDNDFTKNYDHLSRLGTYDPSDAANDIFIEYSEDYFGKFSRICIAKPVTHTTARARFIITKGEKL
tara:strand:+ start:322 stop:846 length:525 start_codon:yes stop_codon:yes gene_type:complete